MAFDAHANLANSLVAVAPSPDTSGTSLEVSPGQGTLFPAAPFNCIVCPANTLPTQANAEIVRVTAVVGDAFTIIRAQEGTSAKNIAAGYYIANAITVKTLTDVEAAATPGGSDTQVQYNDSGAFGGNAGLTADKTTGALTHTRTGVTPDSYVTGLTLINSTTAAANDQQHSPSQVFSGQGWKTNATAASQQVDARITLVPVQGSSTPTANLVIAFQLNGGGYTDRVTFGHQGSIIATSLVTTGDIDVGGGVLVTGSVRVGAAQYHYWEGSTALGAPADGILLLSNNALTGFTRLNFGGNTSSEPAIQRSGTQLIIGTADGGTAAGSLAVSGPVVPKSYTVATLPSAASFTYGIVAVSDANEAAGTSLGTAPTGGGAVKRMVYSDGANWLLM